MRPGILSSAARSVGVGIVDRIAIVYCRMGFTKFTQLHEVTSQFVMFISCALCARIEDGTGSSCEVNFHLQLALVLRVMILYL